MTFTPLATLPLLAALLGCLGAVQAQQRIDDVAPARGVLGAGTTTSNVPLGSGEASTLTNGVPNLSASNPQPGELGIQTRLTVRQAPAIARAAPSTRVMGAAAVGLAARPRSHVPVAVQGGTPD